jgi:hypothetical protein
VTLVGRELRKQEAERRRKEEGRAERLDDADADRDADRRGGSAGGGGEDEDAETEQEGAFAPERVRPAAGGDEAGGEDDRVGAEDPRERGEPDGRGRRRMSGKAMLQNLPLALHSDSSPR